MMYVAATVEIAAAFCIGYFGTKLIIWLIFK